MTERYRLRVTSTDERFFRLARPALALWLVLLLASGEWYPDGLPQLRMYVTLLALILIASLLVAFMHLGEGGPRLIGPIVVACDLAIVSGYTYLFRDLGGAFYPAVVMFPVVYALIVPKRIALWVTAAVTGAYTVGYWWGQPAGASFVLFAMTAVAVPAAGSVVAISRDKQRLHEHQTELAVAENAEMNQELQRRLSELQAVSLITEIVHSTLEFDNVGPDVLNILSKVIAVDTCSLFVIDKQDSETLFSATHGMAPTDANGLLGGGADRHVLETHFTCFPIFDHERTTVVFCASAEDAERLTHEDMPVLRAVASELVVAAENSRLYKLSQHLAVTDELTGLPNYRSLQSLLDREIGRAKRYDKRVSLLMIDADGFKSFNDSEGHVAGDAALQEMARVIASSVREVDAPARYGGEEFSVVLPETDGAGAFVVAEKIREAIATHRFSDAAGHKECTLTVSIGVATYPAHASDKDSLLRAADDALYHAKNSGRDRVRTPRSAQKDSNSEVSGRDSTGSVGDTEPTDTDTRTDAGPTGD